MCLGSLWMYEEAYNTFLNRLAVLRQQEGLGATLKWTKVKRQYLEKYKRFVDLFFDLASTGGARFNGLILDTQKIDHRSYNEGDEELGYYKFFCQLLVHRVFDPEALHYVAMDRRTQRRSDRLETLTTVVNRMLYKKYGTTPIKAIVTRSVRELPGLQLNDVLLGAMAFHKNGQHLVPDVSVGKLSLAAYMAEKLGRPNLGCATPRSEQVFNVWLFQLRPKKK